MFHFIYSFLSLKNIRLSLIIFVLILLNGCASSVIKVDVKKDDNPYIMFGKNSARDFYNPVQLGDSLVLRWESEINGSFNNSSVTVYDNFVFSNDLSGRIYCFDINTGKVLGKLKHKGAVYTTPVINNFNIIYAAAYSEDDKSLITNYNYNEGKIIFEKEVDGRVITELVRTDNGIIFTTEKGKVYRFGFRGEIVWQIDTKAFTHSSPALENGILSFGNDEGEITAIDAENGKIIYRKTIAKSFFSGFSISEGKVYAGNDDGNLYVINDKTGELIWNFDTGSRIAMTPAVFEDKIFIGNLSGDIFLLNKETGKIIWQNYINGVLNASPLITNEYLIISNLFQKYHFVDLKNGEVKKTIQLEARTKMTPVYEKNFLFIGYDHGIIRAYEILN